METCEPRVMFDNLQELIEDKDGAEKMPVRKFYNNTFNTLLNRAIFALTKKQQQHPNNMEFFTKQGMIKFVAFQLLDNPPPEEKDEEALGYDDDEETV